jgi:N-acyl-D-amino-acid deacylase
VFAAPRRQQRLYKLVGIFPAHHGTDNTEGQPLHSILIRDGMLIDGTGAPAVPMDLTIDGAKITGIHKRAEAKALMNIDAAGKFVCPGFVDIHSHSDIHLLANPLAESKIMQGVTTELVGNCGGSAAPLVGTAKTAMREYAEHLDVKVDWTTMDEYLLRLNNIRTSVNVCTLVGAETVRKSVLGDKDVQPSGEELDQMRGLVADAMLQGAFGISSGLIYAPGCYATTEELIALASTAASFGGMYASHIRGEGRTLVKAVAEAIRIGREAHARVEISHHKACGPANWGKVKDTLEMITQARAEGVDVAFDVYPYTASCTSLDTILPPWAREGGKNAVISRLQDPVLRARIVKELETPSEDWEAVAAETDWENITLVDFRNERNKRFENKSVASIAREMGKNPTEMALELICDERLQVSAIFHEINEDDVLRVISNPLGVIGSDGCAEKPYGPNSGAATHPRAYGTFPRVLRKYAIDGAAFSVEEAVRKMTSTPAERIGLEDRGVLAKGMAADVVVFDPSSVRDRATFENSHMYPEGMEHVIVNGALTVKNGKHTKERNGLVLRHKPAIS